MHLVADVQRMLAINLVAIHKAAVGAADIINGKPAVLASDDGMNPRDMRLWQLNVVVSRAADADAVAFAQRSFARFATERIEPDQPGKRSASVCCHGAVLVCHEQCANCSILWTRSGLFMGGEVWLLAVASCSNVFWAKFLNYDVVCH